MANKSASLRMEASARQLKCGEIHITEEFHRAKLRVRINKPNPEEAFRAAIER